MKDAGSAIRLVLAGAMLLGFSYLIPVIWFDSQLLAGFSAGASAAVVAWKGAGVALLALWCALQAREFDGWLVAAVMAFGALGDVLLETAGLKAGASAFMLGHAIAMLLYFRNWRPKITVSQRLLAALTIPVSVFIAAQLAPAGQMVPVAIYTFFVAGMAASAWISRFPRYRTGLGGMMFLASDLLIFSRMGPLAGSYWISPAIWFLYFSGQLMIATGVTSKLAEVRMRG